MFRCAVEERRCFVANSANGRFGCGPRVRRSRKAATRVACSEAAIVDPTSPSIEQRLLTPKWGPFEAAQLRTWFVDWLTSASPCPRAP